MAARTIPRRAWNQVHAAWKWLISFRKSDWKLADYPIELRTQEPDTTPRPSRLKLNRFAASIVNWDLSGTGDTPAEALDDLRHSFESVEAARKEEGKPLPRPGVNVPIEFAPRDRVKKHAELSKDFIQRVLGLPWAFISDESSLWDFHEEETNDGLLAKIREIYGVDVSDIGSARLWEIFERVEQTRPGDRP